MGVDYYSYLIIGLEIDHKKLFRNQKVKTFDHNYSEDYKFDPKTGKKLWEIDERPVKGYNGEDKLYTYKVVHSTDKKSWFVADKIIVCNCNYDYSRKLPFKPDEYEKIKEKMKFELEAFGIWDEKKFGIYNVIYCSY